VSGSAAVLRVRLVGRFAIERGTVRIDERQLGSRKSRLLIKVLAARRGHVVAMDEIIEILWGHDVPARAEANVATLVSRLRGVVGVDAITGGRNGYRLNVGSLGPWMSTRPRCWSTRPSSACARRGRRSH
jgi:DNA-binding SARP family transcriptional activator